MEVVGNIDKYDPLSQRVQGWLALKEDGLTSSFVVIKQNDEVVAEVPSNEFREDLLVAGIGDGCFSFDLVLPSLEVGKEITFTEKKFGLLIPKGSITIEAPLERLHFQLDFVDENLVQGWAYHSERKTPLEVEFYFQPICSSEDRLLVAKGVASDFCHGGEGDCGFTLTSSLNIQEASVGRLFMLVEGVEVANLNVNYSLKLSRLTQENRKTLEKNRTELDDLKIIIEKNQLNSINSATNEESALLQKSIKELKRENDFFQLQIHKIQEELEKQIANKNS